MSRTAHRIWPKTLLVVGLIVAGITLKIFEDLLFDIIVQRLSAPVASGVLVAANVVLAIALFMIALYALRARKHEKSFAAGGLLLISVTGLLPQLAHVASVIITMPETLQAYSVALDQENALVERLDKGRVVISGPIGNRLLDDILALDDPQKPISIVDITSEGGLVDVALEVAQFVEERNIIVVVNNYCMSACVLIAVASAESAADENAFFGIHRTSPLVNPRTEIAEAAHRDNYKIVRDFLNNHGVPEVTLTQADQFTGDDILELSAKEMVDSGAIKYLTVEGKVVAQGQKLKRD